MKCYRSGGCGPYEMYSCSECPYSKPQEKQLDNKAELRTVLGHEKLSEEEAHAVSEFIKYLISQRKEGGAAE